MEIENMYEMNQKKVEALREKWVAGIMMLNEEYFGAREKLLNAQRLYPKLDNIDLMLIICEMLLLAGSIKLSRSEIDYYWVLELIMPSATYSRARCHCEDIVTLMQSIKDEFPGTELAIELVQNAFSTTSDQEKHFGYDFVQETSLADCLIMSKDVSSNQFSAGGDEESASSSESCKDMSPISIAYPDTDKQVNIVDLNESSLEQNLGWHSTLVDQKIPNQDFYNFEEERNVDLFEAGQVWATHYRTNGRKNAVEERWCNAGLPVSSGTFFLDQEIDDNMEAAVFSYECSSSFHGLMNDQFEIYPKRGEIWAIYKDLNVNEWSYCPESLEECEFQLVEMLTDYSEDTGGDCISLLKVCGFTSVFQRLLTAGRPVIFHMVRNSLHFSHKIPAYRILDGLLELDHMAVPNNVIKHIGTQEPLKDISVSDPISITTIEKFPFQELQVESKISKHISSDDFAIGQVWAVYCGKDAMPRQYAQINNMISKSQVCITFLEPEPTCDYESWCIEDLPIACGTFKLGKTNAILEMFQFSHYVKYVQCTTGPCYMIYPQKGEIWAMYRNWNNKWKRTDFDSCQYCIVEVISDLSKDKGIKIMKLERVQDCLTLFHGQWYEGFNLCYTVPEKEILSFSHQIPSYRVPGIGSYGIADSSWHLEPDALPL
ncbi:DnaJ domain containing protein [Quillaja saponaria]|uniref:DnaJ domain containing protein n=1 Tax=Quillaja saponaria TaxID=32244 RepID=A0AAD7P7W7_QUISA|nr:DnaJ domain containing protein [Quillaja saponaria]